MMHLGFLIEGGVRFFRNTLNSNHRFHFCHDSNMKRTPKTIQEIYDQFLRRREALIKALVDGMTFSTEFLGDFLGAFNS